jgi:PPE-repeat protein
MTGFALLPPEINSALIYAGAGSWPLFVAAAAWDGLAADLHATAAGFDSVTSTLASTAWTGSASAAMAAAATPHVGWLSTSAGLAEAAAAQARAAATAFETAKTATVHPAAVAANRSTLLALVATNFLGQNTPAIAATEFQYVEMWAQDVAAMLGYHADAVSVASLLTPFSQPPTGLAGLASQGSVMAQEAGTAASAAAPQMMSAVQSLPLGTAMEGAQALSTPMGMAMSPMMTLMSSAMQAGTQSSAGLAGVAGLPGGPALMSGAEAVKPPGGNGPGAAASLGGARLVGGLSVPPTWAGSMPARMASSVLTGMSSTGMEMGVPDAAAMATAANGAAAAGGAGGMPMMPMMPMSGAGGGMPGRMLNGGGVAHVVQSRPSVVPRTAV